jgi:hypothetical protein
MIEQTTEDGILRRKGKKAPEVSAQCQRRGFVKRLNHVKLLMRKKLEKSEGNFLKGFMVNFKFKPNINNCETSLPPSRFSLEFDKQKLILNPDYLLELSHESRSKN